MKQKIVYVGSGDLWALLVHGHLRCTENVTIKLNPSVNYKENKRTLLKKLRYMEA